MKETFPRLTNDPKNRTCKDCFGSLETGTGWFCRQREMIKIKKDSPICWAYEGAK